MSAYELDRIGQDYVRWLSLKVTVKSNLKDAVAPVCLLHICDLLQISSMVQRLDCWCKDVNSMELLLETKAHEFLTL